MVDGEISIVTQRIDEALAGAEFRLWRVPFFLNLVPTEINTTNGAKLVRGTVQICFNTHDDKARNVKSHLVTFTYPHSVESVP